MPSAKYSWDGSPEKFAKGSTAMELMLGKDDLGVNWRMAKVAAAAETAKTVSSSTGVLRRRMGRATCKRLHVGEVIGRDAAEGDDRKPAARSASRTTRALAGRARGSLASKDSTS